jgi:hypothetical protein
MQALINRIKNRIRFMKLYYLPLSFIILTSCSLTRYTKDSFAGKEFFWNMSNMIGKSIVKFTNDSSFVYSERDSLFVCTGTWVITPGEKIIYIKGSDIPLKTNLNPPISITLNKEFKIVSASKLKDEDMKLFILKR